MAGRIFKSELGGFEYTVVKKRIKSVNIRVRRDGSIAVSAPYGISDSFIRAFVEKNSTRIAEILSSLPSIDQRKPEKTYSKEEEAEFLSRATAVCRSVEPLFFCGDYEKPKIELCRGRSRWGYCMPKKNIIRLNVRLSEYPEQCLKYVAVHEYCHLLVPNHSAAFYRELEKRMPNYKSIKEQLAELSF